MKKFINLSFAVLLLICSQNTIAQINNNLLQHKKDFNSCNNYSQYASFIYGGEDLEKVFRRVMQLCYENYFSFYDPATKTPLWTFEVITNSVNRKIKRIDDFKPDPFVPYAAQAKRQDYARSGFDRGHMAAAANMTTPKAMEESFYFTNIVPQVGVNMNRGIWVDLENTVRAFAQKNKEVVVITGALFTNHNNIGKSKVYVPSHLYKIIYIPETKELKHYILPNVQIVTRKTKELTQGNNNYSQTTDKAAINCGKICNSESFRIKEQDFINATKWNFKFKR